MKPAAFEPYAPLDTPKPLAEGVWIIDGPEIAMKALGLTIPFPTRMTVVRLPGGDLWVHSPVEWSNRLAGALERLGRVRHLVAPNTLHYWYMPDWKARFPGARTYGAPGLLRTAKRQLLLDETLGETPPEAWEGAFDQLVVRGPVLTEVDFLHRQTGTLILTDLIENFEMARVRKPLLRWLIKAAGAADPDGKAPIDMQLSFLGYRAQVRKAVEQMISWAPERIILAHGRCYEANGTRELRRAFRWVL